MKTTDNEKSDPYRIVIVEDDRSQALFAEAILRGAGMPPLQRGRTGDLKVVVNVTVPKKLNREQRELMERLAATLDDDAYRTDEGMLAKLKRAIGSIDDLIGHGLHGRDSQ